MVDVFCDESHDNEVYALGEACNDGRTCDDAASCRGVAQKVRGDGLTSVVTTSSHSEGVGRSERRPTSVPTGRPVLVHPRGARRSGIRWRPSEQPHSHHAPRHRQPVVPPAARTGGPLRPNRPALVPLGAGDPNAKAAVGALQVQRHDLGVEPTLLVPCPSITSSHGSSDGGRSGPRAHLL